MRHVLIKKVGNRQLPRIRRWPRGELRGQSLGVTLSALDGPRSLDGLAFVVITNEDPHFPIPRPFLPY
jgi:hypothetical protein